MTDPRDGEREELIEQAAFLKGSGGFVWSSLLDEIALDQPVPTPPADTGLGAVRRTA